MMLLSLQRFRNAKFDNFLAREDLSLLKVFTLGISYLLYITYYVISYLLYITLLV